jgi:hypothetical protein
MIIAVDFWLLDNFAVPAGIITSLIYLSRKARLEAAPCIVFEDLRHGWEAVPFQNSNAESFSASCSAAPVKALKDAGFSF